ncbi:MAG: NADH:flavin oxidoreductase [Burkholderiales bacterium]|nr:NADH:flavin oxidoreductase [Burkholderiales bacterium]
MPGQPQAAGPARHVRNRAYPSLFSPFQLGRLDLRNRAMVPAMTTNFAQADGSVGDALIGYLVERARGGFGSIVTENIGVHPGGRVMPRMLMADDDRYVPGLRRLAAAVRSTGSVLIGQLSHAGRQTRSRITGQQLVAPSAIPCPLNREMPRELTTLEIEDLEEAFIASARRLAEAGFDGIEIHGAHGYLVGSFLSAYSNRRSDAYGGTLENRMRFLRRIISGIKSRLGAGFPLIVRISACEFVPRGLDVEQAVLIAKQLHADGVHALSVSVGVYESFNKLSMITGEPEGQWIALAGQIRSRAAMPVIGVGRIKRASVAEAAIANGQIDIAAFGRASIADPQIPAKIVANQEEDTVWCLGCNVCLGRSARPETICPVNPLVGRESTIRLQPARHTRAIAICDTSVAALTAAWIAAVRGHRVTLFASDDQPIGGMQAWRARIPGQQEYGEVIQSVLRRAINAGARISDSLALDDDTEIWRARRYQPVDRVRLSEISGSVTSYAVLSKSVHIAPGCRVVVIGDDLSAAEAALLAASRDARVILHSSTPAIAADAHPGYREVTRRGLLAYGGQITQDAPAFASGDLVVVGHTRNASYDDRGSWLSPLDRSDRLLADAYEPGAMTRGIYEAFETALDFDGP